jgi:CheY-like chemotaxis protein
VGLTARSERAEAGERLVIDVSDTGIGIPAASFQDIFESFSQVDTSITRQYGGTGLGLAICRDLTGAMGGSIGVTSELGKGSVFTVTLPLRRGAAQEPEPVVQAEAPSARALRDCRLLVIEANPLAQSVLRGALGPRVAEIEVAGSAEAALEALSLRIHDHVLADGAALGGEEDERLQSLTALAATAGPARLSLMWPSPDAALKARILAAGAAQVLAKPITPAELAAALERWFAERSDEPLSSEGAEVTAC